MPINEQKTLTNRAISRAKTGLYFIVECLDKIHRHGTDAAFSRSIYILLSFNFELILKSRVILTRSGTAQEDLLKDLKHHDLEKISRELPGDSLNDINISSIAKRHNMDFDEYEIKIVNGEKIIIQDLVDVRYDFIKNSLRNSDPNESGRIRKEIDIMLGMIKKMEEMLKQTHGEYL